MTVTGYRGLANDVYWVDFNARYLRTEAVCLPRDNGEPEARAQNGL